MGSEFVLSRGCQCGCGKLTGCSEASGTCGKLSWSLGSHGNSWVLGDSGTPAKLQACEFATITVTVRCIVLCSPDYCSEFVHMGPVDSYLSKASPHCADQPYIHAHLCWLNPQLQYYKFSSSLWYIKTLWSCSLALSLVLIHAHLTKVCDTHQQAITCTHLPQIGTVTLTGEQQHSLVLIHACSTEIGTVTLTVMAHTHPHLTHSHPITLYYP